MSQEVRRAISRNPYEQIVQGPSAIQRSSTSSHASSSSAPSSSGVLSKATKRHTYQKPPKRLGMKPRYRFDLPPPPMDCKMLLGTLSPKAFAEPVVTSLERNFRPVAIPADACYGLKANLVDTSIYEREPNLSLQDDALLLSIESGRSASNATVAGAVADPARRSAQKVTTLPPPGRLSQAPAPWMRRMSYDEYFGKSTTISRPLLTKINQNGPTALGGAIRQSTTNGGRTSREENSLQNSFELAKKTPKHPDRRKASMKPVSVVPVFPSLQAIGEDFIAIEFEKGSLLTHESRIKETNKMDLSTKSMATLSLAEGDKKFLACYTPSDEALDMRLINEDPQNQFSQDFVDEKTELFDWVMEYSIREGGQARVANSRAAIRKPTRQIYMLSEHKDSYNNRVATLARIGTSWKLSRRPGTLPRLGKSHLRLTSVRQSKDDELSDLRGRLAAVRHGEDH